MIKQNSEDSCSPRIISARHSVGEQSVEIRLMQLVYQLLCGFCRRCAHTMKTIIRHLDFGIKESVFGNQLCHAICESQSNTQNVVEYVNLPGARVTPRKVFHLIHKIVERQNHLVAKCFLYQLYEIRFRLSLCFE